jgi:hypothetical protein
LWQILALIPSCSQTIQSTSINTPFAGSQFMISFQANADKTRPSKTNEHLSPKAQATRAKQYYGTSLKDFGLPNFRLRTSDYGETNTPERR